MEVKGFQSWYIEGPVVLPTLLLQLGVQNYMSFGSSLRAVEFARWAHESTQEMVVDRCRRCTVSVLRLILAERRRRRFSWVAASRVTEVIVEQALLTTHCKAGFTIVVQKALLGNSH